VDLIYWSLLFLPYEFFARPIQILKSEIFQRVFECFYRVFMQFGF